MGMTAESKVLNHVMVIPTFSQKAGMIGPGLQEGVSGPQ